MLLIGNTLRRMNLKYEPIERLIGQILKIEQDVENYIGLELNITKKGIESITTIHKTDTENYTWQNGMALPSNIIGNFLSTKIIFVQFAIYLKEQLINVVEKLGSWLSTIITKLAEFALSYAKTVTKLLVFSKRTLSYFQKLNFT